MDRKHGELEPDVEINASGDRFILSIAPSHIENPNCRAEPSRNTVTRTSTATTSSERLASWRC